MPLVRKQPPLQTWVVSDTHRSVNSSLKTRQAEALSPPTSQPRISKGNSIDVNDRYPRCCCGSRGAVGQDALAPPRPSIPQAQRASRIPGSHEDSDKTDDSQSKARPTETLELTEAPAPAGTPRLEMPRASGMPAIPLSVPAGRK